MIFWKKLKKNMIFSISPSTLCFTIHFWWFLMKNTKKIQFCLFWRKNPISPQTLYVYCFFMFWDAILRFVVYFWSKMENCIGVETVMVFRLVNLQLRRENQNWAADPLPPHYHPDDDPELNCIQTLRRDNKRFVLRINSK